MSDKYCKDCIHLTNDEKRLAPGLRYCPVYQNDEIVTKDYNVIFDNTGKQYKEKKMGKYMNDFETCKNWNITEETIIRNARTEIIATDIIK